MFKGFGCIGYLYDILHINIHDSYSSTCQCKPLSSFLSFSTAAFLKLGVAGISDVALSGARGWDLCAGDVPVTHLPHAANIERIRKCQKMSQGRTKQSIC